jgi:hypothetical protein
MELKNSIAIAVVNSHQQTAEFLSEQPDVSQSKLPAKKFTDAIIDGIYLGPPSTV